MHDIQVTRGLVVRVQRNEWRGKSKVDIRQHYGYADADSLQPTRKGVSLDLDLLPELLAALHAIEKDAIASGDLLPEDYTNAGLTPPANLEEAA